MLKKLQDLLFEEEEDDIEEEEEEKAEEPASYTQKVEVQTVQPEPEPVPAPAAPKHEPAAVKPAEQPAVQVQKKEEPRPAMQRIDVTQSIPVVEPKKEPARTESVFREEPARPAAPKFDIKVDEKQPAASAPKQKKSAKPARNEKPARSGYQFQPVISPIFGVDEKDMNALKTTTTKISEAQKAKNDPNISPIISPMYGVNQEDKPSNIQKTARKSNEQEKIMASPSAIAAEEDILDFSLDDILAERDEEFASARASEATESLFSDLNFWDEEPESAEDATIVIEKPE